MEPSVAVDVLEREAATIDQLLEGADLGVAVPSCPGWTVADLIRHLGGIHRWARHAVLYGKAEEPEAPEDPAELRLWFREGAAALVETFRGIDPDKECWTFSDPSSVRFWLRRQAHETTLHRWDLSSSLEGSRGIDKAVAADGINEVVGMFLPRQLRLGRLAPGPEVVELACDAGPVFRLAAAQQHEVGPATATVSGPAQALLLLLWKRTSLADERLTVSGSRADVEVLLGKRLTP